MRRHYASVHLLPRLHALCFNLGYGRSAFEFRWRVSSLFWNPFIPENERYRMIFIHVPKTGGVTVLVSLFGIKRQLGHKPALAYQVADEMRFSEYFKFCVVRNPWDRIVSAFFFLKQGGMDAADKRWAEEHLADYNSFPEFARALANRKFSGKVLGWKHFLPQSFFICGEAGDLLVDHVARQERLDQELRSLAERWRVGYTPIRTNASKRLPYEEYYDDETRDIIMNVYQEDITRLGYSFVRPLASVS